MTVAELIEALRTMPQDVEAKVLYDVFYLNPIECLVRGADGSVVLAEQDDADLARESGDYPLAKHDDQTHSGTNRL